MIESRKNLKNIAFGLVLASVGLACTSAQKHSRNPASGDIEFLVAHRTVALSNKVTEGGSLVTIFQGSNDVGTILVSVSKISGVDCHFVDKTNDSVVTSADSVTFTPRVIDRIVCLNQSGASVNLGIDYKIPAFGSAEIPVKGEKDDVYTAILHKLDVAAPDYNSAFIDELSREQFAVRTSANIVSSSQPNVVFNYGAGDYVSILGASGSGTKKSGISVTWSKIGVNGTGKLGSDSEKSTVPYKGDFAYAVVCTNSGADGSGGVVFHGGQSSNTTVSTASDGSVSCAINAPAKSKIKTSFVLNYIQVSKADAIKAINASLNAAGDTLAGQTAAKNAVAQKFLELQADKWVVLAQKEEVTAIAAQLINQKLVDQLANEKAKNEKLSADSKIDKQSAMRDKLFPSPIKDLTDTVTSYQIPFEKRKWDSGKTVVKVTKDAKGKSSKVSSPLYTIAYRVSTAMENHFLQSSKIAYSKPSEIVGSFAIIDTGEAWVEGKSSETDQVNKIVCADQIESFMAAVKNLTQAVTPVATGSVSKSKAPAKVSKATLVNQLFAQFTAAKKEDCIKGVLQKDAIIMKRKKSYNLCFDRTTSNAELAAVQCTYTNLDKSISSVQTVDDETKLGEYQKLLFADANDRIFSPAKGSSKGTLNCVGPFNRLFLTHDEIQAKIDASGSSDDQKSDDDLEAEDDDQNGI